MVSRQDMSRWMFHELQRNASAVGLLQCINKLAVTIFKILVDDFDLAFELDLWSSSFPLRCRGWISTVCVRVVCENKCACEENDAREKRAAEDPGGTDLYLHGGTFLLAMIASWTEENEITQVQSRKDISEVHQPLCFPETSALRTATSCRFSDLIERCRCMR